MPPELTPLPTLDPKALLELTTEPDEHGGVDTLRVYDDSPLGVSFVFDSPAHISGVTLAEPEVDTLIELLTEWRKAQRAKITVRIPE